MSEAVAAVTGQLSADVDLEDQRRSLVAAIQARLRKADHAAAELSRALEESEAAGRLRSWGELLLAYASQIPGGSTEAVLPGFDGEMVTVPLDRTLTPVENAQHLFERYARMRDARPQIDARLGAVRDDQRYLASTLAMAETASGAGDLAELRRELADEGYLPRRRGRVTRAAQPRTVPLPEGAHLLVGRSNRDNDHVTFKVAGPDELWFHARGVPGAHVILRTGGRAPTDAQIEAAASAAAHFSAARGAARAAVDYTARKHVRKPRGSKPGMVTYERETTVQVKPGIPR
jgi:predicted ribosome quality control (RQC) complex YloA/Tae2 family protein